MCYSHKNLSLFLLAMLISFSPLSASIINVPADQETIQEAMNSSDDGDTVLVHPGIYVENINFHEKSIVLASLFLTTGNDAYLDSTIIDGDESGTVVTIEDVQGDNPALTGFTIRNGRTEGWGGGISFLNSSVLMSDLMVSNNFAAGGGGINISTRDSLIVRNVTVRDNYSQSRAGGIFNSGSHTLFIDVHIINNESGSYAGGFSASGSPSHFLGGSIVGNTAPTGGGIYLCSGPDIVLTGTLIQDNYAELGGGMHITGGSGINMSYCQITGNSAERAGGGACLAGGVEKVFTNVTVANNLAPSGGGFRIWSGQNTFINCIIRKNGQTNISAPEGILQIAYSDIGGGIDGLEVDREGQIQWGDGNIDANPYFVDSGYDFNLTDESPCINTGDPDSPEDVDCSRADMGGIPFLTYSIIGGYVLDEMNQNPIENCSITTSLGESILTDCDGYWSLCAGSRTMEITATYPGYNPATISDIRIDWGDTLSIDMQLTHPEFQASTHELGIDLAEGESTELLLTLTNDANGYLEWEVETNTIIGDDYAPWDLRQSFAVSQEVDDLRIKGAVLVNDRFYVTGRGDEYPMIYVLDRDGTEFSRYIQPGQSNLGMRDLAYDGELIWGSGERNVYGFTPDGDVELSFESCLNPCTNLTWDTDREILWISNATSDIIGYDRDGNIVVELNRNDLRVYGLAYFSDDSEGCPLYIFCRNRETEQQEIYKVNPDTDELIFVRSWSPPDGGYPSGAFIINGNDNSLSTALLTTSSTGIENGGDRLNIWHLDTPDFWIDVNPKSGILISGATCEVTVSLKTYDPIREILLPDDLYDAYLEFTHNAAGGGAVIPVTMIVADPSSVGGDEGNQPDGFAITSVYPNPFNSLTNISYLLPERSDVSVKVFDLAGRVVETLWDANQSAGRHTIAWDALEVASGLYFVRVSLGQEVRSQKVILAR
jgi:hypothetical protein